MNKISLVICYVMMCFSCKGQVADSRMQSYYNEGKIEFEKKLVDHFPAEIYNDKSIFLRKERLEFNDVGLYLYEKNLSNDELNDLLNKIRKINSDHYTTKDSCLLIVNRFTTQNDIDSNLVSQISDSSMLNKPCYANKLPVPNFIEYSEYIGKKTENCGLDSTFVIYVIESKKGNSFYKEPLSPNKQMPKEWQNGYSKGIAISRSNNTAIYWIILW